MFKFMVNFKVVTTINAYRGYNEDKEYVKELIDQFTDVAKHFGLAYTSLKRHVVDVPPEVRNRDNMTAFGTGKMLNLTWSCITTPTGWDRFCNEIDDYVKDKNYANFTVYYSPH